LKRKAIWGVAVGGVGSPITTGWINRTAGSAGWERNEHQAKGMRSKEGLGRGPPGEKGTRQQKSARVRARKRLGPGDQRGVRRKKKSRVFGRVGRRKPLEKSREKEQIRGRPSRNAIGGKPEGKASGGRFQGRPQEVM